MKRGTPQGYTILEVMIFLAVTTALFVMVAISFQGTQAKAEFSSATREVESQIRDVINDVSTGYYGASDNFSCDTDASGNLRFSEASPAKRGTNSQCVYIGKILHFGISGEPNADHKIKIYSVAGLRQSGTPPVDTESLPDARPVVIPSTTQTIDVPPGLVFGGMQVRSSTSATEGKISAITVLSPGNSLLGRAQAGSLGLTNILPLPFEGKSVDTDKTTEKQIANMISDIKNPSKDPKVNRVTQISFAIILAKDFQVCYNGDATNQHVIYTISGAGSKSGEINTEIGAGKCPKW